MAEDSRDILMKMVLSSGSPPPSECQALITPKDSLATGFTFISVAGGGSAPNYFAIDDFTFEIALKDKQSDKDKGQAGAVDQTAKVQAQQTEVLKEHFKSLPGGAELASKLGSPAASSSEFKRFILTGADALGTANNRGYVGDLAEITITKRMDVSSPVLFKSCITSEQFKTATILKRKAVGQDELRTYMRIDFNQLMMTSFDWSDDDVVKEVFKFACRQAIVTYAIEDYGGNLLVQPATTWQVLNFKPQ
jgi:type VI protein secretion system component Hcp